MADDERPSKMQKREHDSPEGEATFAPSEQHEPSSEAHQPEMDVDEQPAEETNDASNANPSKPGPPPGMTKSAWKKLRRQQEWEAGREQRKVVRKEKAKARKQRKRDEYAAQRANGDAEGAEGAVPPRPHPHKKERQALEKVRNQRATQVPVTFVFDCSFDDLMMDKELKSLGQQITRAYSDNRSAPYRAHLAVSSFGGKLKERFDGTLAGHYKAWKSFRVCEEDYVEVGEQAKQWMADPKTGGVVEGALKETARPKTADDNSGEKKEDADDRDALISQGKTIYLSSEGTETLHTLKPYHTYIIGGLVDKNRYKGICHKRATERGIKTAKLPIGEFLQMNSRAVLATNHVSEIMLRWLECGDWGEAFMKVIPKRKGGQLRSTGEEEDGEGDGEAEAEAEAEAGSEAKEKAEDLPVVEEKGDAAAAVATKDVETA
ncbi:tRNA m(1)G methyltransferase domain-containing protein [Phyllosticta citricarpa]|uniref:tRNA (guanine(9)-N1)-methyltransferase n=1 Tax=Phyllosticta citricarpa TaxID=55181 RepID=A0ABR1M6V9_9PEZI